MRLGGSSFRSSTVNNTTNPDWPDTDVAYFIVHNREQELQVETNSWQKSITMLWGFMKGLEMPT